MCSSDLLIALVYTVQYLDALPVMHAYLVGIGISSVSVSYALPSINKGSFAVKNNALCLTLSALLSITFCLWLGPVGAAIGSVVTLVVSETWSMRAIAVALETTIFKLLPVPIIAWVFSATAICFYISTTTSPVYDKSTILVLISKATLYILTLSICAVIFHVFDFKKLLKTT